LPEELGKFYGGLLASEARHFEHYLEFARQECCVEKSIFDDRLNELKVIEADLISSPDPQFRFHSGVPSSPNVSALR
ncbi:MAG: tRNA-(ms[2]io[6]A)-hydroxylase, partial [Gammaproteobacteria bacterium]|nr:tRNA-(ms[2]io[6]A)-hydroxylase [Gammaproteobacteria bacterium]